MSLLLLAILLATPAADASSAEATHCNLDEPFSESGEDFSHGIEARIFTVSQQIPQAKDALAENANRIGGRMPVSIEVDADSGVAIGKCSGVLGLADAKAGAARLWKDPAWTGLAVVWDFRDAKLNTSGAEVFELAQYINAQQRSPGPARVAFVTSRDVDYGQVRIFEAYRERPPTEVQVFRDFDAAVDWARAVVRTK